MIRVLSNKLSSKNVASSLSLVKILQGNHTLEAKKHTRGWEFTLKPLVKKHKPLTHGWPRWQSVYSFIDPTAKNKNPMIEDIQWSRSKAQGERRITPVARLEAIRIFLAYAAYMGFMVYQMDVKSAFLNAIISEEAYVKQPPGYQSSEFPNHVCKLYKALYGLKQAPRAWYETLSKFLIQHKFIRADSASVKRPMLPPNNLGPDESGVSVNETLFRGMIGSLMYLTASRSDIQFFTCLCARYQANPKESHLVLVKRNSRYLKGTPNLGLWYPKGLGFDLKAYSDSNYAGCNLERKSTSLPLDSVLKSSGSRVSLLNMMFSMTRYHFIKDHILKGDIKLHFIPTDLQLVDIFTKSLVEPSYTRLVAELENYINDDLTFVKPYTILVASFQMSLAFEVSLTSHMLKVAKLFHELEQSLILSSEKVNDDDGADKSLSRTTMQPVTQPKAPTDLKLKKKKILPFSKPKSSYKVRVILPKKQVTKTQHTKESVATTNATKSLGASESAKEQVNQPKTTKAEMLDDDAQITFLGVEPSHFEYDQSKSTMHGASDSDSGLRLMLDDDLASLTCFETPDSADDDSKEGTAKAFYASADMPVQSDPLGPLHEELRILNTKIDKLKSSIAKKVTDDVQSSLIKDSIKQSISESIKEKLPVCAAHVQQSLQNELLKILLKPMNKEYNALNTLESCRFVMLQKELSKVIRTKIGKSDKAKVRKGMSFVFDRLAFVQSSIATNSYHVSDLYQAFQDMNFLFESVKLQSHPLLQRCNNEDQRGNDTLNVVVHNKFRLKTLGFSEWLELGVPPPPELSTFGILVDDRKRKRSSEILQEVFVKETIVVDGMHRNLTPPPGIEGRRCQVIRKPEARIFYYNGNFDLVFQRESEFYLTSAGIEGLAECKASASNLRRIQVKDIIKEVKDHLKTYSSAGMDISWYVEGIRCGSKESQMWQYTDYSITICRRTS
ncbi:retrovirus-related pol polyprotein from transposon TNT 1-94 [Tanacetum coccineum]